MCENIIINYPHYIFSNYLYVRTQIKKPNYINQMQKISKLIFVLAFILQANLHAQITLLDQTLLTEASFNTFTPISITGTQGWNPHPVYGAVCTGYSAGQTYENEDWLISPAMNLSEMDNAQLTFSHTRGSAAVLNVGVAEGWYKVFATADFTGDPLTTQWIELEGLNQDVPDAWQFISSGTLTIPDEAKSANTRIAFRYISSDTQSATWEVKNVKVTGSSSSGSFFKITNWNTEWLGCTNFGPTDEEGQINNIATAMLMINADIYCIQEVSNTVSNPSIETIVNILGNDEWGGAIAPSNTGDCNQRQGIIYKKSKVQFVSAMEMSTGNSAQGNSYHYNWSNGRYPALYNVNLIAGNTTIPVSIVNIHAKAEDGEAMSYTRRLGASQGLKAILDGSAYNSKNVIVIGDFNDYLIGTTSNACNCSVSPYNNFMEDESGYTGITQYITDAGISWGDYPVIENIIISNELADNYMANSAIQEETVAQNIDDYHFTTSDHLPVSAMFQFTTLSTPEYAVRNNSLIIYPNPVKDMLNITTPDFSENMLIEVYDMTGRQVLNEKSVSNTINVNTLPAGIYIVKTGNNTGRFVKE